MTELDQENKDRLKEFCEKTFQIIQKNYPKIRSIIIQLNNNIVSIGHQSRGTYKSIYYHEQHDDPNKSEELIEYVEYNKQVMIKLKNYLKLI